MRVGADRAVHSPYLGMGMRLEGTAGAHTAQVQQLLSPPKRKGSAVDFHHGAVEVEGGLECLTLTKAELPLVI